ncbi:uncharacterized protein N0V89_010076 [Didymosphaeria variabile]|uniref:P-loop containing nucleoside triphosphate hydrolase protein n=1 Tax=Didymosphaeria variabile TaxID=1932322 RepID=A0A9W8XGU7_9PLEO|nr:uncharacterized protein N0V89_010076 [Didymosphaeria variabile]KAJ4348698.1 hypothetical protein N0V89_010076 [Didymosphaeria variabile]
MSEWDRFRQKAVAAVPEGEALAPRRFFVAVLLADRDPNGELSHVDFRWIKAHSKITIAKIRETYISRLPGVDVDLWFEGAIASPDTQMRHLGTFDDPVIALRAVERPARPPALALRSPSSNRTIPPPSPAVRSFQPPPPAPQFQTTGSQSPRTPGSAHRNGPLPPWEELRDQEKPSIETSARPFHFTRVNSTPLSDVPSSLIQDHSPGLSVPIPTTASHQPTTDVPPYAPAQPLRRPSPPAQAEVAAPVPADILPAPEIEPITESSIPPQAMVKPEQSPPARSPDPEDAPPLENFNPDDVFDRDPSPEIDSEACTQLIDRHIRDVIEQSKVDVLEAGVARSMYILEKLRETFSHFATASLDAKLWIDQIDKMKEQSKRSRTIVGVVGNTGAGKSSVINALLDEERLVPTNCMRACTAVVTEISWNADDDPGHKYSAEVEFIDRADWEKDLRVLMREFLSENGTVTREAADPNSDAGIAWAKFHAVYPRFHKDELEKCTVEMLMRENAVLNVLGTTKRIHRARPEPFYAELQKFVDSKEKVTSKKDKEQQKQQKNQMEYWPLIKVVRLYTKSEALSTGAVVVDLPGVHDSNAARAAVAERYIQQCSGLWIVAPITRAVDDKAAKNLLGGTFKRQLKYDGSYSAVTFICSKTDDISITEAVDSLGLDEEVMGLETQAQAHKQEVKGIEEKITELKDLAEVYKAAFNEADEEIETWEDLKDRVETETLFPPKSITKPKRKMSESGKGSRKRRQVEEESDIDYVESGGDDSSESENEPDTDGIEVPQEPLTLEDVEQRLADLKNTKKNARNEKKVVEDQIQDLRPTIRATKSKIADVKAQILAICIEGRNKYSKGAIQQDFAAGIKELDQEAAVEADEAAFNPDEELRDYEEVASSLPVFCVSSRAYQKMCGRLKKDEAVPGFRTQEETEIPQLKTHCMSLTESGRIQNCRTFLLNLCSNLTTFFLWASNDGTGLKMTDTDQRKQADYLLKRLGELEKGLEKAIITCLDLMKAQLQEQIFERMNELISDAIQSAPTIANSWGYRDQGGLYWATYKATVRRGGVYHSPKSGHRDFKAELLDPIIRKLATGWERAFRQRLPRAFEAYTKKAGSILHTFHKLVEDRAHENGVGLANLAMLKGSIYTYEHMFQDLNAQLKIRMTESQRDASRHLVPVIANVMMTVYDICTNESGSGSFHRMKEHMVAFVQQNSPNMFPAATRTVEMALLSMCNGLKEEMANKADEIYCAMRDDYMRVLGGVQVAQMISTPERSLKAEIMAQLKQIDVQFERIANGNLTEDDPVEDPGDDTGPGADMEAEQQLHFENNDAASTSGTPAEEASPDDETLNDVLDDTVLTEPSPAAPKSGSRRHSVSVNGDEEEDREL